MKFRGLISTCIYDHRGIGENVTIHPFTQVCEGAKIVMNTIIGHNVFIGENVHIGEGCRIQGNVYIPEGVYIGNNVFIGPGVTFTNTKHPQIRGKSERQKTMVCEKVIIGAGATILSGITLYAECFIGAGAVVTKDVLNMQLVAGNPAKPVRG